ncbi:MAG TPA: UbiA family prenyltransferase, partial [bacterium]|nr:UbiA family prenyltransferase [bacterium]
MSNARDELHMTDPFVKRLWAYFQERFPIMGYGVLIISYYSSNQFLSHALNRPGEPMHYSGRSLAGGVILLCIFFHLRVFDEHKDYADDCKHYPHRVLQQGLITLRQLKWLSAAAIATELILAICLGFPVLSAVLIALAFSLLMLKEFFAGEWLKRHFLLYAVSHMLIMPLLALIVYSISTRRFPWHAPGWFWVYAFVGFFVTFNWEISRKIRAPGDEVQGVGSYSRMWGVYGAAYAVLLVRVIDTLMVALVGWHLGVSPWFYGALTALYLVCLIGFLDFRFRTSTRTAKRMEIYAGIYIIAFDLTLAVEIARLNGL